jgi:hypothetical protein
MKEKLCNIRGLRLAAMICLMVTTVAVFTPCFQTRSLYAEVELLPVGNQMFVAAPFLAALLLGQISLLVWCRQGTDLAAAVTGVCTFLLMLFFWYGTHLIAEAMGSIQYMIDIQEGASVVTNREDITYLGLLALALALCSVVCELWLLFSSGKESKT